LPVLTPPPPPRSPRFPYTTLFRSRAALDFPDRVSALAVCDGVPILEALEWADRRFATEWWHWFFFGASPHAERVITADPLARYRDRKSTRLNSSHVKISYAVFCLK